MNVRYCIITLCFLILLLGCTSNQDSPTLETPARYDWNKISDQLGLKAYLYDTAAPYGSDYYVGHLPLEKVEGYARLEAYVDSTTGRNCSIIRVKNEFNPMGLNPDMDSLQESGLDEWNNRVPYILGEICFVIQSRPDALRFVFLTDWSKSGTIIDTTIEYHETYIEPILTCSVDTANDRYLGYQTRNVHRPFDVTVSVLTETRAFSIYSWQLWYYTDCGRKDMWIAADGVDDQLMRSLLQTVCRIYAIGGFREKYGLK